MKKIVLILASLSLALPAVSWATLGQPSNTPFARVAKSDSPQPYSVQETKTSYDLIVKEFVDAQGIVFAVSWSGPVRPNMRDLLGTYFSRFVDASKPGGPTSVKADDLVLFSGGHMGAFSGAAYVPGLLPANFDVSVLK